MKRLVIGLVLAILVLSLSGIPVAASPPDSSNIEKVTFIHYAKPAAQARPVWDETATNFKLISGGVKWFSTISYEVNPAGSGIDATVVGTFQASSATWDAQTSAALFNAPTAITATTIGRDNINRVVWGALNPGIIAVTYLWYNKATKQILEFDMVYNTYYKWSTTGAADAMDLQDIATHELGHNGLGDLYSPKDQALTMYGYSSLGETQKRTLGTGDILGIQKLYGM